MYLMEGWKVDKDGRRYREVGPNQIEHMPTITIDGHEMEYTQENIQAYTAAKNAAQRRHETTQRPAHTGKQCPFNVNARYNQECKADCALYRPTGCAQKRTEAVIDTQGKFCPYLRKCPPLCALYDHGCTI